jgi:hypothetical protein
MQAILRWFDHDALLWEALDCEGRQGQPWSAMATDGRMRPSGYDTTDASRAMACYEVAG